MGTQGLYFAVKRIPPLSFKISTTVVIPTPRKTQTEKPTYALDYRLKEKTHRGDHAFQTIWAGNRAKTSEECQR